MNLVGARLQIHVDHATGPASVLRVIAAGENLHLTDRFHRRPDHERRLIQKVDDVDVVDRKSTRLNSSHPSISYAVFCLKKKKYTTTYHEIPSAQHCRCAVCH